MLRILSSIILITFIVVLVVFIYYLIYSKKINKKIQSGQVVDRKMMDIPKTIKIAMITLLLAYFTIVLVSVMQDKNSVVTITRQEFAVIDLTDYKFSSYFGARENDDASFAQVYSKESNEGYKKTVVKDGDFIFTVFTTISGSDNFHPDFLCYVDYVGEDKSELRRYTNCQFIYNTSKEISSSASCGVGEIEKELLYVGNLNGGDSFKITESLLDATGEQKYSKAEEEAYKEDKGQFPSFSDYAISSGSVTITID